MCTRRDHNSERKTFLNDHLKRRNDSVLSVLDHSDHFTVICLIEINAHVQLQTTYDKTGSRKTVPKTKKESLHN